MLNGLGFELPLMTSFPETLNGSRMEVFFIARKVKLCESPSKAGGLPILIIPYGNIESELAAEIRLEVNPLPYRFQQTPQNGFPFPGRSAEAPVVCVGKPDGILPRPDQFRRQIIVHGSAQHDLPLLFQSHGLPPPFLPRYSPEAKRLNHQPELRATPPDNLMSRF